MNVETKPTMHRLRPYLGYVTAIESPVDEEQRDSGLIVTFGDDFRHLHRAVVLHVASDIDESGPLHPGTVIYYRVGDAVLDVLLIHAAEIVAYVEDS